MRSLLLFAAAAGGGALNAIAGGGTFLSFPALLLAGVPPVQANATSTVALWPGAIGSFAAYRSRLPLVRRYVVLVVPSFIGAAAGAQLLVSTSELIFVRLMPLLLLAATLLFAFAEPITRAVQVRVHGGAAWGLVLLALGQGVIAVYGGYFGGGMGIVMLALYALTGIRDVNALNALKSLQIVCINGIALATFAARGTIAWPEAGVMVLGGALGGWLGAHGALRVEPRKLRRTVVVVGLALTAWLFARTWGGSR
jgi:uncharacterized membrane protein YfcA